MAINIKHTIFQKRFGDRTKQVRDHLIELDVLQNLELKY